jgi:hypothetical protein
MEALRTAVLLDLSALSLLDLHDGSNELREVPLDNVEDRQLREMLKTLDAIEELLTALIELKNVPESSSYLGSLVEEVQRSIDGVAALQWLRLSVESPEEQRDALRCFAGLVERTLSKTIH